MKPELTFERAKKLLDYRAETGLVYWLSDAKGKRRRDKRAGCKYPRDKYWYIEIDKHRYLLHRVIWLLETGLWPKDQIDHINCDKSDNRWENLREATQSQNCANVAHRNPSGFKGIASRKDLISKPWQAQIMVRGKRNFLGRFATREEAAAAYKNAAKQHFGEFARIE